MRFVITHIRNEAYLLNWWLRHHKDKFDHGIIIDYNSNDESLDLVREIAPTWQVVTSVNKDFNAYKCDLEVFNLEKSIQAQYPFSWMVTLNVTEFLIGDTKKLLNSYKSSKSVRIQKLIPCDIMVDTTKDFMTLPDNNLSLVSQRMSGIPCDYSKNTLYNPYNSLIELKALEDNVIYDSRLMRSMHNFNLNYFDTSVYSVGRHYWGTPSEDFRILWYGYSPFNEKLIERKLAIQTQIPEEDKNVGNGIQHIINRELAISRYEWHKQFARDLSSCIKSYENN